MIVGSATGLLSVIFILAIKHLSIFLLELSEGKSWLLLILPACGAFFVGYIVKYLAPEAKGHGIPEVMLAVALRRGIIRPFVAVGKILASILTIGTGGSAGREGPIVQIGAAVGSSYSQFLKLGESRTITLLSAGAAAGIAATFNAPIAGVIFVTEVIMRNSGIREFSSLVIASVSSSVISHAFLGNEPAFHIPHHEMSNEMELPLFVLLGAICSLVGVLFIRTLFLSEIFFDKLKKIPSVSKPVMGALIYGPMLFLLPLLYGGGFPGIELALNGELCISILIILIFAKIIGTSICLGSGSSGGVFAPTLFVGAMTGAAFGKVVAVVFPGGSANSGAYAVIGMAAVFAACDRAPVTAILLVFEMTRDYSMILPLMFASVVSALLAEWMHKESIYTCKLKARGIDLNLAEGKNILELIKVKDCMTPFGQCFSVPPYLPLKDMESHFMHNQKRTALVVSSDGKLMGMMLIKDLYSRQELLHSGIVSDIARKKLVTLEPDDSLEEAALIFASSNFDSIPVMSNKRRKICIGELSRNNLADACSKAFASGETRKKHIGKLKIEDASQTEFAEYAIHEDDSASGKTIAELSLPEKCNIVALYRGKEIIAPRGSTDLRPGDTVLALCEDEEDFIAALKKNYGSSDK